LGSKLYEIVGVACGLVLINYGFNIIAAGLPGSRSLTSQFLGANLLVGGCVVTFLSLYYLLRPTAKAVAPAPPSIGRPDVGIELISGGDSKPQVGFYRNIEYVGYFFTALGLFSAADLALQVFIPQLYNETRWWVELLLITFGVLSYAIFFSIGRIGMQEERTYSQSAPQISRGEPVSEVSRVPSQVALPENLEIRAGEFNKSASGEYERHLSGTAYDLFHVEKEMVTVWREDRVGIRSAYLAGPYELSKKLMHDHLNRGEELKVGKLVVSPDALKYLLSLQEQKEAGIPAARG
jgi:hypothetical protein